MAKCKYGNKPIMGTNLYRRWSHMKERCDNPKPSDIKSYGHITYCDEWRDFAVFKEWALSNGYSPELTIERIDVRGNYCPENCCWVDAKAQANNRTTTIMLTLDGITKPLAVWCDDLALPRTTVWGRLKRGWEAERALLEPIARYEPITYNGKTQQIHEWATEYGIPYTTLYSRLNRSGMTLEQALNYSRKKQKNEIGGKES